MLCKIKKCENPKKKFTDELRLYPILYRVMTDRTKKYKDSIFKDICDGKTSFMDYLDYATMWAFMSELGRKPVVNAVDDIYDQIAVMFDVNGEKFWFPIKKEEFDSFFIEVPTTNF